MRAYERESPSRARPIAFGALLALLAFAAGWLLRDCEGEPIVQLPPTCPECPAAPVCEEPVPCPSPAATTAVVRPSKVRRPLARANRELPDVTPPPEADRRALLAWVAAQTPALRACSDSPLRMTARLTVDAPGVVRQVRLHAVDHELPSEARSCIERTMRSWQLPESLRSGPRELVVSIVL